MEQIVISITPEQAQLLKDSLECLVECAYDSSMGTPDEEGMMDELSELIRINRNLCEAMGCEETESRCYQWCVKDLCLDDE